MAHEVGHLFSLRSFGTDTNAGEWLMYRAAMAADRFLPSGYARRDPLEHFSETLSLFLEAKGSPVEAEIRALFPASIMVIETWLAAPPPR